MISTDLTPSDEAEDTQSALVVAIAREVARMLTTAIAAYHRDEAGARVFSLAEAAERLHMSEQRLTLECRGRGGIKVAHTRIGKFRGMTNAQIERYAAQHAVFDDEAPTSPTADIAAAIAMSKRSGASRRGRDQAA